LPPAGEAHDALGSGLISQEVKKKARVDDPGFLFANGQ
jgi:hypothetical protein